MTTTTNTNDMKTTGYLFRWLCACGFVGIICVIPYYLYLADLTSPHWPGDVNELFGWPYPDTSGECFLFATEALLIPLGVAFTVGTILFLLVITCDKLFKMS